MGLDICPKVRMGCIECLPCKFKGKERFGATRGKTASICDECMEKVCCGEREKGGGGGEFCRDTNARFGEAGRRDGLFEEKRGAGHCNIGSRWYGLRGTGKG